MPAFDPELGKKQDGWVQYMLRPECDGAALLAADMGLGKTKTALMFARAYQARVILAVVPLQTIEDWESTANIEYPGLPVKVINSSKPGGAALTDFTWRVEGVYLITHQYWEKLAWIKTLVPKRKKNEGDKYRKVDSGIWGHTGFLFIYDESHRAANYDSWTFKALMNLTPFSEGGPFKVSMSGTFMGDKFSGAFGASKWLWSHRIDILPNKFTDWCKLWAETKYDPFSPGTPKVVGELEEGAFVSSLPCYIREESNMAPPVVHELHIEIYPEQRRVYDELDDKMVAWINENPLVAEYSITKRVRQRQTTLAMPTLTFSEDGELLEVDFADDAESAKIDRLFLEIDGGGTLGDLLVGESILLLTDSQKFARLLTLRLNNRYGDVAREWSGDTAREKGKQKRTEDRPYRKGIKQDFIDGKLLYIVGVQSAMGTGTDGLQYGDARIVAFMSRADRRIDNEQGISRLNRTGQEREVHEIQFTADNTIDTGQWSAQMIVADKQAKSMRKKDRQKKREEERERRKQALQGRTTLG